MEDKQTQRVTLDDLAAMVQRNFETVATKAQVNRVESLAAQILVHVEELPERIAEKILDYKMVRDDLAQLKRTLRDKHHLEV